MRALPPVLVLLAACGDGGGATGFGSGPGVTTVPAGTSSTGSTGSTSTGDSTTTSSTGSTTSTSSTISAGTSSSVDLGTPPDFGEAPPPGCQGKIDLLFAVSSSPTMKSSQDSLKASFPSFVAVLEEQFADFDHHIMTTDGDSGFWGIPSCKGCVDTCPTGPADYPCGAQLTPCDYLGGAGITFPAGWNATNKRCELVGGHRYITKDEPDLLAAFSCIAATGTSGSPTIADGTLAALTAEIHAPGACNEGFLRPDALLVVVVIQDSADQFSAGTSQEWADALLAAKKGDGDAVVLLVITTDVDDPDSLCGYDPPGVEHRLRTWTELMPHARFGSICAPNYAPFFAEAATLIKSQCDVFAPQ